MTETQTETPAAPTVNRADLPDLARLVLETYEGQVAEYNSRVARLDAATGDVSKAIHDIRDNSDDKNVVKFREYREKVLAELEKAEVKIAEYIKGNLVPESMSDEEIAAEKEALKTLKAEAQSGRDFFLSQPAVKNLEGAETLLPALKGARKSVSKGTGAGGSKPRVGSIYVDGDLVSHEVTKDGKTEVKSTFTDAVKFLSDTHKVKVQTSDLHAGYFATAGTNDVNAAPDSVEYVFSVTDKDGKSHNHTILVTK